uniref:Uncharacterized protein n=1 Tax=Theileria parva TaxID=5875 RepID=Q4N5E9_THEPA
MSGNSDSTPDVTNIHDDSTNTKKQE